MMLMIDDGDVVDKSPWPDVETGNMICAVGLHSLLRDKLASKIADDEEDTNFCCKRISFYRDIAFYLIRKKLNLENLTFFCYAYSNGT